VAKQRQQRLALVLPPHLAQRLARPHQLPQQRPPTTIWSASMMVDSRCATMTVVQRARISARLAWIWRSVSESSALVASSSTSMAGCGGRVCVVERAAG
jgi:hypothetical protein